MPGLTDRHFFWIAVLFYGASTLYSLFLWRQGFKRDNWILYGLLCVSFAFHSSAMLQRGFSLSRCPINNLYEATLFIAWTMVAACLLLSAWPRLRFLGAFASPVLCAIGVFALMPALDTQSPQPELDKGLRSLHASLILLACGGFGLSAVAGAMFLIQEHDLKFNKLRALTSLLPPVQRLDRLARRLILGAWMLLTLGLGSGSLWLKRLRGEYFVNDPIIVWSYVLWLFYLALLLLHWKFAQRGRRFAWGAFGGFLFIMLTFWGFYLLSPVHHR